MAVFPLFTCHFPQTIFLTQFHRLYRYIWAVFTFSPDRCPGGAGDFKL
jgi:hypothetical protein